MRPTIRRSRKVSYPGGGANTLNLLDQKLHYSATELRSVAPDLHHSGGILPTHPRPLVCIVATRDDPLEQPGLRILVTRQMRYVSKGPVPVRNPPTVPFVPVGRYSSSHRIELVRRPGFEPGFDDSKSSVLPLHHLRMGWKSKRQDPTIIFSKVGRSCYRLPPLPTTILYRDQSLASASARTRT